MSVETVGIRPASAEDAGALAAGVVAGVADYPAFAPAGWRPPSLDREVEHLRRVLAEEHTTCLVAEHDGRVVGQVTILPAARAARAVHDPELAHLANLFVDRDRWGSGLAERLTTAAAGVARERGFTAMRLFVAEGQARARRFYEREGWRPVSEPFFEPALGLTLVEYRRGL